MASSTDGPLTLSGKMKGLEMAETDLARVQEIHEQLQRFSEELEAIRVKAPECDDKFNLFEVGVALDNVNTMMTEFFT